MDSQPLCVSRPVARAVPAAAESVMPSSERVSSVPRASHWMESMARAPPLAPRPSSKCSGPAPSEMNRITFSTPAYGEPPPPGAAAAATTPAARQTTGSTSVARMTRARECMAYPLRFPEQDQRGPIVNR